MTYYDLIIRNPWETEKDLNEALDLINQFKRSVLFKNIIHLHITPNIQLLLELYQKK